MCASGLRISTPEGRSMSAAVISPGPVTTSGASISVASECIRHTMPLRLSTMSVTSSLTSLPVEDDLLGRSPGLDGDHVGGTDLVGRDVHAAAVDGPVAVADELARLAAGRRKTEAHEHVVEPALEHRQQVLTGDAGLAAGLLVVVTELLVLSAVVGAG